MENNNYIKLVNDLNQEVYNSIFDELQFLDASFLFIYETDGLVDCIKILGVCLWDSDNDDREVDEEGEYEPLKDHIVKKFKLLQESINDIKL